MFVIEFSEY